MIKWDSRRETHAVCHERAGGTRGKHCQTSPRRARGSSFDSVDWWSARTRGSEICPRPTGTTSLSRLTIIESRLPRTPNSGDGYPSVTSTCHQARGGPMSRSTRDVVWLRIRPTNAARIRTIQPNSWLGLTGTANVGGWGRIVRSQSRVLSAATWRFLAACEGRP